MDTALQILFSYQFLLFCLAVSATTYVITLVVEHIFQSVKIIASYNYIWKKLILPILPIVLGSVAALIAIQYPYPEGLTSASGRFAFGLVAGLLSGFAWRWIKAIIGSKMKVLGSSSSDGASAGIVDDTEK